MADGDLIDIEELKQKHRKENRELQSKIVALKKSCKNDKRKKKEIAEEILQLESELKKRHQEELSIFKTVDDICNGVENASMNDGNEKEEIQKDSAHRVTRAQKRRDKKANKEKERAELIEAQELANISGCRNIEMLKINEILRRNNYRVFEIPSNGNCLYCAVDHQFDFINGFKIGYKKLRTLTSEYLKIHKEDYLPFLNNPHTEDLLSEEEFEDYCEKIANTAAWGGEVELCILSHILKHPIEVIQAEGPPRLIGEEHSNQKITITYHRHMYGLGEHYNSVELIIPDSNEENT